MPLVFDGEVLRASARILRKQATFSGIAYAGALAKEHTVSHELHRDSRA